MVSKDTWRSEVRTLLEVGAIQEATDRLNAIAKMDYVCATVELSRLKWRQGEFLDAASLIHSAEIAVQEDDLEGHFDLHVAYAMGIGPEDRGIRLRLSFDHLRHAAKIGKRPRDLLAVALHFRDGLNEVEQDRIEARKWCELAAETGDADAVRLLRSFDRVVKKRGQH